MSNLRELGMYLGAGMQVSDHTARHHARGKGLGLKCLLGTFAEHTVISQASCIKMDDGSGGQGVTDHRAFARTARALHWIRGRRQGGQLRSSPVKSIAWRWPGRALAGPPS
jgi:hypothetical protein